MSSSDTIRVVAQVVRDDTGNEGAKILKILTPSEMSDDGVFNCDVEDVNVNDFSPPGLDLDALERQLTTLKILSGPQSTKREEDDDDDSNYPGYHGYGASRSIHGRRLDDLINIPSELSIPKIMNLDIKEMYKLSKNELIIYLIAISESYKRLKISLTDRLPKICNSFFEF